MNPSFTNQIIAETINKIKAEQRNIQQQEECPKNTNSSKSKYLIRIQYRGVPTREFVYKLKKINVPAIAVITMRKLKTMLPSLKPNVEKSVKSKVIYKITCPGCGACYVGQTSRHCVTHFSEHKTQKKRATRKHYDNCKVSPPNMSQLQVLDSTNRSQVFLETLEALYIREIKPKINDKDEYKRILSLKF